jgi:hypothetical protein
MIFTRLRQSAAGVDGTPGQALHLQVIAITQQLRAVMPSKQVKPPTIFCGTK